MYIPFKPLVLFTFLLMFTFSVLAQKKYVVSGNIHDKETGEDLIGASITLKKIKGVGATSNVYGFYSLSLEEGDYELVYSFIGYETQYKKIRLTENKRIDLDLGFDAIAVGEVTVKARKENANVVSNQMSVAKLDLKEADVLPVIFGEKDIMKSIQLMPGVQTAGEGASGFYVRGGSSDQNAILLDEASIYNASHLMGFFSVFNSDALRDVKLYKGAIPASYGGRLSSVLDTKMKEGNNKQLAVSGGIGLISSKLTVEAPIVKNKGSFIVSGRRTYADLFLKLSADEVQRNSSLYFYDLNMKANYKIGTKDRVYLSGYLGSDHFGYSDQFSFSWGNKMGTLRWNRILNSRLFSNTSLIASEYHYQIAVNKGLMKLGAQIKDISIKQNFDYFINNKMKLQLGGSIKRQDFNPGYFEDNENLANFSINIQHKKSLYSVLYLSNEHKITPRLSLTYGCRWSNFMHLGPGDVYSYNEEGEVKDTSHYKNWEKVKAYNDLSPRFSFNFKLNERSSIKGSYARTHQYLHLMSNSTSGSPTDVWLPSSNNIKPEEADQWAVGYFRNFDNDTYEFSTELYYKTMNNIIDFKSGTSIMLNETIEGDLLFGKGRAGGFELYLKKRKGRFSGWISYTLAFSQRKIDGINHNKWYAAKQDRTHDISIVANYKLSKKINLSAVWVFYTGNAVTFPSGKYKIDGAYYNYYTERNGYRMPDYHRLDLSMTYYFRSLETQQSSVPKKKRKFESSINISLYNAYMRENAYSISFREDPDNPNRTQAVQLSLFRLVPSISYNFKF